MSEYKYIDSKVFIDKERRKYCKECVLSKSCCTHCWVEHLLTDVLNYPAADVQPVIHAHWVNAVPRFEDCESGVLFIFSAQCSACGGRLNEVFWHGNPPKPKSTVYCPKCGAKMDEVVE